MGKIVAEGDKAPAIRLPTDGGGEFDLAGNAGSLVVVYFYPKDDTSGCTLEARDFTALRPEFDAHKAVVVGISPDTVRRHDAFKAKHDLSVMLAADPDKGVLEAYGVWVKKSMYGREYMGVERSTFLIDPSGRIARVWRKVSAPGHAGAVLEAVRQLAGRG